MGRKPFEPWRDTVPGVRMRLLFAVYIVSVLAIGQSRALAAIGFLSFLAISLSIPFLILFSLCGYYWWYRERRTRRDSTNDN
jgi:hypothetical protein